jgi:hypothetical protein
MTSDTFTDPKGRTIRHQRSFDGYSGGAALVRAMRQYLKLCQSIPPGTAGRNARVDECCAALMDNHGLTLDEWWYWYEIVVDFDGEAPEAEAEVAANAESDREVEAANEAMALVGQYREAIRVARSIEPKLRAVFHSIAVRRWPHLSMGGVLSLSTDGRTLRSSCGGTTPHDPWHVTIKTDDVIAALVARSTEKTDDE